MSAVLLVGADPVSVATTWNPSLANAGVNIIGHWDWSSTPQKELPEGCEGVVVLNGKAGPPLVDGACALAKQAKVPFIITDTPASAIESLQTKGLTVNTQSLMRVVEGKVVLPAPPADTPRWMVIISMETVQWAADIAWSAYSNMTPTQKSDFSSYVLKTDAAGTSKAGSVPKKLAKTLAGFAGNPSGMALLINLVIPAGAALAGKTTAKVYRAATKRGMDGYPAHMAAWATGRRLRGRDEPSWNEMHLEMANTAEKSVGPVKAMVDVKPPNQAKIDELEGQVSRLGFDLEAKTKAHRVTIGKYAGSAKALKAAEAKIEGLKEAADQAVEAEAALEAVRVQNDELVNANHQALVLADKAADELVAAKAETLNYKREYDALRRTVDVMFDLGPDATLREMYDAGYYVLKSRRYNPNDGQSMESSSTPDNS